MCDVSQMPSSCFFSFFRPSFILISLMENTYDNCLLLVYSKKNIQVTFLQICKPTYSTKCVNGHMVAGRAALVPFPFRTDINLFVGQFGSN